jgi:biotin--protein ligase
VPPEVEVVARYAEPPAPGADVAAVRISRGQGKALLLSVHPEYPLEDPPARDAISKLSPPPTEEAVEAAEKARFEWFADLLAGIGLHIPSREEERAGEEEHLLLHPTHPSPVFALSHPKLPELAAGLLDAKNIQAKLKPGPEGFQVLRDGNDEFEAGPVDAVPDVAAFLAKRRRTEPEYPPAIQELSLADSTPAPKAPDMHALTKTLLLPGAKPYNAGWTPLFNFDTYWAELDAARKRAGRSTGVLRDDKGGKRPALGDLMLYGEAVTSTQTMLDRNPVLLGNLPSPLSFLASFQLSGRGRGSNAWLSPAGCLQWSMLLTLPANMVSKMVLIQYLTALAVAEAVDEDGRLGVRIKWPNDIYAQAEGVGGTEAGSGKKGLVKIGGILVNTNFINGQWRIVVGTGVNVLNALPTTSLSQLHNLLTERAARNQSTKALPPPPTMEGTLARIMNAFEAKWAQFVEAGSFEPFMAEYHARWLHSNQEVTLTTVTPHQRLRIVGITPDYGLMRCVPITSSSSIFGREVGSAEYVELQPDGNSFDLMAGMIKKKV